MATPLENKAANPRKNQNLRHDLPWLFFSTMPVSFVYCRPMLQYKFWKSSDSCNKTAPKRGGLAAQRPLFVDDFFNL
jgi:hypothetical protein